MISWTEVQLTLWAVVKEFCQEEWSNTRVILWLQGLWNELYHNKIGFTKTIVTEAYRRLLDS